MAEENKTPGFEVRDRRRSAESETAAAPPPEPSPTAEGRTESAGARETKQQHLNEVTFTTFILSLSTSALISMGEIPDPTTGETQSSLAHAKQIIDILGLMRDKTKGNLQKDEEAVLDGLLYDLRMKYLQKTNQIKL